VMAEIALAVSPRSWSHDLHQFIADHGGARVRTRVMSGDEALAESYDVLIVDDVTSFVTRRLVDRIRSSGRFVLGVYDPAEAPEGKQRLIELGVDDVIEAGASPEEFLIAVRTLAADRDTSPRPQEQETLSSDPPGTLVAVAGAAGGVGSTEVSVALAGRLARPRGALLIDGDDHSPAIAQRLGLPLHPSIRTALDSFHHGAGDPESSLQPVDGTSLFVLGGLAGRADWSELRSHEVLDLTRHFLGEHEFVVVNVGSSIGNESPGVVAGPVGLARSFLGAAGIWVVVADSSPVGVARLLAWLARDGSPDGRTPHLVLNRAPKSAYRRSEMQYELAEAGVEASVTFAPNDRAIEESAWEGRVPRTGPFVKAIRVLARSIAAEAAT
ncbi:MAG: hypothetical protein ACE5KX_07335, partial [Acidimicrobiia bacterium]